MHAPVRRFILLDSKLEGLPEKDLHLGVLSIENRKHRGVCCNVGWGSAPTFLGIVFLIRTRIIDE
jgi:hypothetical protein